MPVSVLSVCNRKYQLDKESDLQEVMKNEAKGVEKGRISQSKMQSDLLKTAILTRLIPMKDGTQTLEPPRFLLNPYLENSTSK